MDIVQRAHFGEKQLLLVLEQIEKRLIESGAFNFSIATVKRLKAEYDELLKQGAQTEVLETAKQELARRRHIHILGGHNWNKVLGSVSQRAQRLLMKSLTTLKIPT